MNQIILAMAIEGKTRYNERHDTTVEIDCECERWGMLFEGPECWGRSIGQENILTQVARQELPVAS